MRQPRTKCCNSRPDPEFLRVLERTKRKIYSSREEARRDVFDYIEMFYNPKRRHNHANGMSPIDYEKQYFMKLGVV